MDRPTGSSHAAFTLALLVAAGGVAGYLRKRSLPSLLSGLGIGATFGAGGYMINSGRPDVGHPVALAASLALVGAMTPRAIKTGSIWPAGVLAFAGWLSTGYQAKKSLEWLG